MDFYNAYETLGYFAEDAMNKYITKRSFCFRMECPPGCPEIIYQIMRSCWKWDPSDRPNFWEIHHSLVSLLQPIQYYEEEEFIEPPIVPSFVTNDVASQGKYAEHDICQCNPLGTLG